MSNEMSNEEHKTKIERQIETREVVKRVCANEGCRFFGQEAQQGVCYTTHGDLADWGKLDAREQEVLKELEEMREREGDDYVRALEAHYVSVMTNWQLTLDECVRLRRGLALARTRRSAE